MYYKSYRILKIIITLIIIFKGSLLAEDKRLTTEELEWIRLNRSTIRVGIHEYPPLIIKTQNGFDGISIQYLRNIEKETGINFQFVFLDSWTDVLQRTKENQIDIIFAIQETPERQLFLNFTSPYLFSDNQIIVKKGAKINDSLSTEINKKVAIVENSALYNFIQRKYPNLKLVPVRDELNALAKVSTGEVDLSIGEISRISYYFQKELFSNLTIAGTTDFQYKFRFGIRKDIPNLKNIMEKALGSISQEERTSILKNWIYVPEKKIYEETGFWIWLGSSTAFIIIIIILYWNRTLNQLVDHKTRLLRESEEAHRKAKEQAEAGNRAKSEFLASMSHEIRTPLNAIIGFTDLLTKTKLNETQSKYMGIVYQSAGSLLDLLNDILDFSKIEAGKLELNIEKIDLFELIGQVADVIKYKAKEKKIETLLNMSPSIPRYIHADPVRLRQVLVNLLSNAVKFTHSGEIELKVEESSIQEREKDTMKVVYTFSVRDTGIGISEEHQSKIFEAFSQVDSSTTRKYGGTGLGLTISNQLLKLMDSKLELISEYGKGSKFFFTLSTFAENDRAQTEESIDSIKNVLIVDDNHNNRIILQEMLRLKEIESELAANGLDALDKIGRDKKYDVIIMDYQMPELDGIEVIRRIREKYELSAKEQPIILLHSSSDDEVLYRACSELQIQLRILKPIKIKDLFSALSKVSQKKENLNLIEPVDKNIFRVQDEKILNKETGELGRIKILIVDDDEINLYLAKSILTQLLPDGIILEAANGIQAIEEYKKQTPDLIFMDVQMPEMNGYEATSSIRQMQKNVRIPIIAITAGIIKGDIEKCFEAGMDDYASKPIKKDIFERMLIKWLPSYQSIDIQSQSFGKDE